jgi:hypothetical protein
LTTGISTFTAALSWYNKVNTAVSDVEQLSVKNLQIAFAGNAKFRYLLEAQFTTDNALTAYDSAANEYKVKYLYEHSSSM